MWSSNLSRWRASRRIESPEDETPLRVAGDGPEGKDLRPEI